MDQINTMRKLKFKLDRISLETIYTAFIRPLIEYWESYGTIVHYSRKKSLIKYRIKRLDSPQEPLDLVLLLFFLKKSDGMRLKRGKQFTSLPCFIKCPIILSWCKENYI